MKTFLEAKVIPRKNTSQQSEYISASLALSSSHMSMIRDEQASAVERANFALNEGLDKIKVAVYYSHMLISMKTFLNQLGG
jgi:hypothetical protein